MSTADPGHGETPGDPSMADILASIRRILTEDDQTTPVAARRPRDAAQNDVLVLDHSMMVKETGPATPAADAEDDTTMRMVQSDAASHAAGSDAHPAPGHPAPGGGNTVPPPAGSEHVSSHSALTTPADGSLVPPPSMEGRSRRPPAPGMTESATVSAAASSLANLARSVAAERTAAIQRNGLSIEDVVREEVRPLLKAWLDTHLPGLVERLVQAEIERVVNRATF